jgi:TIR domain
MGAASANLPGNTITQAHYHAFLSHNGADKPAVRDLAAKLEERGLACWLDEWNLIPGNPWQPAIEEALGQCDTCLVFFGPHGLGPWHNEEMRLAIQRGVSTKELKLRVIPVILPGPSRSRSAWDSCLHFCPNLSGREPQGRGLIADREAIDDPVPITVGVFFPISKAGPISTALALDEALLKSPNHLAK